MCFNISLIRSLLGQTFIQYQCDAFDFTNSVTQIVGLLIDKKTYALTNIQKCVDYFGTPEDIAVFNLSAVAPDQIHSAFEDTKQIVTPINGTIQKIKLINENQKVSINGVIQYDVQLTRCIIFEVNGREISFEKDNVPFSEEIIIRRGYHLADQLTDQNDFLEEWDDNYHPEISREIIEF